MIGEIFTILPFEFCTIYSVFIGILYKIVIETKRIKISPRLLSLFTFFTVLCGWYFLGIISHESYSNAFFRTDPTIVKIKFICLAFFVIFLLSNNVPNKSASNAINGLSIEKLCLSLVSLIGSTLLVSSNNTISLYLSLELQTLPLYFLSFIDKTCTDKKLSLEASIKYFVFSSLLSCIVIYGISLIYGSCGSFSFYDIAQRLSTQPMLTSGLNSALLGCLFIAIGLVGKIPLFPIYFWIPDLYSKLETKNILFFSSVPKIAITIAITTFLYDVAYVFNENGHIVRIILILICLVSIVIGAISGVMQTNIKRILAYSGILNGGIFLLPAIATPNGKYAAFNYILYYVVVYLTSTTAVLYIINILEEKYSKDFSKITDFTSLSSKSPVLSVLLLIAIFSLIGIPPMAGFFAKFAILKQIILAKHYIVAIVAILGSVVASFYYLKIIKAMYFDRSQEQNHGHQTERELQSVNTTISLSAKTVLIIAYSVILSLQFYPTITLGVF